LGKSGSQPALAGKLVDLTSSKRGHHPDLSQADPTGRTTAAGTSRTTD